MEFDTRRVVKELDGSDAQIRNKTKELVALTFGHVVATALNRQEVDDRGKPTYTGEDSVRNLRLTFLIQDAEDGDGDGKAAIKKEDVEVIKDKVHKHWPPITAAQLWMYLDDLAASEDKRLPKERAVAKAKE